MPCWKRNLLVAALAAQPIVIITFFTCGWWAAAGGVEFSWEVLGGNLLWVKTFFTKNRYSITCPRKFLCLNYGVIKVKKSKNVVFAVISQSFSQFPILGSLTNCEWCLYLAPVKCSRDSTTCTCHPHLPLSLSLLFTEKKGKFLNLDHFTQLSKLEHILVIFNSANSLADFFLNPILLSNADFILKYVNMSDIHEKRYLSDKLL